MVVQGDPAGLPAAEQRRTLPAAREVSEQPKRDLALIQGAPPISTAFGLLSEHGERSTTGLTYLFFSPKAGLQERDDDAHKYAAGGRGGESGPCQPTSSPSAWRADRACLGATPSG